MAIARTRVFVDDYLEYSSTLLAELQRLLNTMRELDERSQAMINQTLEQTKHCLRHPSQSSKRGDQEEEDAELERMRKLIEANQENALSLCTEKVLLARQAYDLCEAFNSSNGDQILVYLMETNLSGDPCTEVKCQCCCTWETMVLQYYMYWTLKLSRVKCDLHPPTIRLV